MALPEFRVYTRCCTGFALLVLAVTDEVGGRGLRAGEWSLALGAESVPALRPGTEVVFGIRPEKIGVPRAGSANATVEVTQVEPLGAETIFAARIAGVDKPIFARIGPDIPVKVGERRELGFDLGAAQVFDVDGVALRP